ncbi:MAG: hypothetical protein ACOYYS_10130 [Chloroflexota bacterium]
MSDANFQPELSLVLAVILLGLHLFGWGYNALIGIAERKGYLEGHTAYSVVLGVAVTLAPFVFFETVSPLWIYAAFVASGIPMIAGSWWRHVQQRRQEQEALRHDGEFA